MSESEPEGYETLAARVAELEIQLASVEGDRDVWRTLCESAPDYMVTVNRELQVVWANRAPPPLSREQLIGRRADEFAAPGSLLPLQQHVARAFETGQPSRFEIEATLPDGAEHWFESRVVHLPHRPELVLIATVEITERVQAQRERNAFEAQLRQQQKLEAVGTLASGVAHEINNPIQGIMNYAELIVARTDASSTEHDFASEILKESERVAGVVRNLLAFSRHEKEAHSPARLVDIITATLSLVNVVLRRDQIAITVDVPEDLPLVKCRSQQIQQVFMNLVMNARDALMERYPNYEQPKRILVSAEGFDRDEIPWVRITVEDNGGGISPDVQPRVFDPFFTTKGRDVGTGLGLSVSHGIVTEHHGVLRFETEPGEWTRFLIELRVNNGWSLKPGD